MASVYTVYITSLFWDAHGKPIISESTREEPLEAILVKHLLAGNDTTAWLKWLIVCRNQKIRPVAVGAVENYRVSYDPGFVPAMVDFNMHLNMESVEQL